MSADLVPFTGGLRERPTKLAIAVPEIIISAPDDGVTLVVHLSLSMFHSIDLWSPTTGPKTTLCTNGHGLPFNFPSRPLLVLLEQHFDSSVAGAEMAHRRNIQLWIMCPPTGRSQARTLKRPAGDLQFHTDTRPDLNTKRSRLPVLLWYWELWTWHINSILIFALGRIISWSIRWYSIVMLSIASAIARDRTIVNTYQMKKNIAITWPCTLATAFSPLKYVVP